ncbi:RNA-protein complex protein Nop10 [Candidatus Bathyarchaeota archaeon]|mgnify:CR=1 FL=1|nr:RNA-protein complex protein Nop10 [Candidatus Bathyarchaeota archaeon]RJS89173.1 MAG: RNA-protein complex protein Nop10 [Candidatus Bathyarchaeota archaeon]
MVWLLRYCPRCDRYTLNQERCPICGGEVKIPHPAKFSMDDRYRKYRLKLMRMKREEAPEA